MTNYVDTHVRGSTSDGPASHSGGRGRGDGNSKTLSPFVVHKLSVIAPWCERLYLHYPTLKGVLFYILDSFSV